MTLTERGEAGVAEDGVVREDDNQGRFMSGVPEEVAGRLYEVGVSIGREGSGGGRGLEGGEGEDKAFCGVLRLPVRLR